MRFEPILAGAALAMYTLAHPINSTSTQSHPWDERAVPSITPAVYSPMRWEQLEQAHLDAIKLASTVVTLSADAGRFDPIFEKYFNIGDKQVVIDVFKQIVGTDDYVGSDLLANVKFVPDFKDPNNNNKYSCSNSHLTAASVNYQSDYPSIIVCPYGFQFGAIGGDGTGAPAVTCETVYVTPRVSWRMETLGQIVLHEYTHMRLMMLPIMKGPFGLDHTTDIAYGFFNVRYIDRWQARQNADSYATMASEMWWKLTCEARLGPLGEPGFRDN